MSNIVFVFWGVISNKVYRVFKKKNVSGVCEWNNIACWLERTLWMNHNRKGEEALSSLSSLSMGLLIVARHVSFYCFQMERVRCVLRISGHAHGERPCSWRVNKVHFTDCVSINLLIRGNLKERLPLWPFLFSDLSIQARKSHGGALTVGEASQRPGEEALTSQEKEPHEFSVSITIDWPLFNVVSSPSAWPFVGLGSHLDHRCGCPRSTRRRVLLSLSYSRLENLVWGPHLSTSESAAAFIWLTGMEPKKKTLMHMRRPIFIAEVVIYVISFLQSSLMTLNKAQEQDLRHCSCSSSNTWDQTDFKGTQEFLVLWFGRIRFCSTGERANTKSIGSRVAEILLNVFGRIGSSWPNSTFSD